MCRSFFVPMSDGLSLTWVPYLNFNPGQMGTVRPDGSHRMINLT